MLHPIVTYENGFNPIQELRKGQPSKIEWKHDNGLYLKGKWILYIKKTGLIWDSWQNVREFNTNSEAEEYLRALKTSTRDY